MYVTHDKSLRQTLKFIILSNLWAYCMSNHEFCTVFFFFPILRNACWVSDAVWQSLFKAHLKHHDASRDLMFLLIGQVWGYKLSLFQDYTVTWFAIFNNNVGEVFVSDTELNIKVKFYIWKLNIGQPECFWEQRNLSFSVYVYVDRKSL